MAKILIIPDIHHRTSTVRWVKERFPDADRTVFLGDIFDDFGDTPAKAAHTAEWLSAQLADERNIFLLGNHDVSYQYPANKALYCSGFGHEKASAILGKLNIIEWREKTKIFHVEGRMLFSHAGISRTFLSKLTSEGYLQDKAYTASTLYEALQETERKCRFESANSFGSSKPHPLFAAGYDRGGNADVGGPLWIDVSRFEPIPGIAQCFGHTPQFPASFGIRVYKKKQDGTPKWAETYWPEKDTRKYSHLISNGIGIDIDSHLCSIGTYDTDSGEFTVHKIVFTDKYHLAGRTGIESITPISSINIHAYFPA